MNVYHVYFSNPTLKEKALALNNNLPPLLSSCFCLDIKHPHCKTVLSSGCVGLNGNFVANSSRSSIWMWGWWALWKQSKYSEQEDASKFHGWRLVGKHLKVMG